MLDAALQNIDTVAWGESHLYVALEVPTWEPRAPSKVKYHSLAPKESKDDPQAVSNLELDEMRTVTRPPRLRMGSIETHSTVAKIGGADTGGRVIIYPENNTTRGQLHSILDHTGYYKKFIRGYALITTPLKDLLTKEARFCWDATCRENISLVLKYLGIKPVLGEDA